MEWGLLGPDKIESQRRRRTLSLNPVVREFDNLAVPQLGGLKYAKVAFLSCLGVSIAQKAKAGGYKVSNIQVANAIEALACFLAYEENNWKSDQRLKGSTKLRDPVDLSFQTFSRSDFYITNPMRMSTVQALPGLGLVESTGERFNSFVLSKKGQDFIDTACDEFSCHSSSIQDYLVRWVTDQNKKKKSNPKQSGLIKALSPMNRLNEQAMNIFKQALMSGEPNAVARRQGILEWVSSDSLDSWKRLESTNLHHAKDLKSGASFFIFRDKAFSLLNVVETEMNQVTPFQLDLNQELSSAIQSSLAELKEAAENFLSLEHDPTSNKVATKFAQDCVLTRAQDVIRSLVSKDNVVLRNRGDFIVPAAAFGKPDMVELDDNVASESERLFPEGVSSRVWNMYLLNLDFENQLDAWLAKEEALND